MASYIRIMAVGLAGAIFADAVNGIGARVRSAIGHPHGVLLHRLNFIIAAFSPTSMQCVSTSSSSSGSSMRPASKSTSRSTKPEVKERMIKRLASGVRQHVRGGILVACDGVRAGSCRRGRSPGHRRVAVRRWRRAGHGYLRHGSRLRSGEDRFRWCRYARRASRGRIWVITLRPSPRLSSCWASFSRS